VIECQQPVNGGERREAPKKPFRDSDRAGGVGELPFSGSPSWELHAGITLNW